MEAANDSSVILLGSPRERRNHSAVSAAIPHPKTECQNVKQGLWVSEPEPCLRPQFEGDVCQANTASLLWLCQTSTLTLPHRLQAVIT